MVLPAPGSASSAAGSPAHSSPHQSPPRGTQQSGHVDLTPRKNTHPTSSSRVDLASGGVRASPQATVVAKHSSAPFVRDTRTASEVERLGAGAIVYEVKRLGAGANEY
jgi:hypothetical protein